MGGEQLAQQRLFLFGIRTGLIAQRLRHLPGKIGALGKGARQPQTQFLADRGGKAQLAIQRLDQGDKAADLGALGAGGIGKERLQRVFLAGINPLPERPHRNARALVMRQVHPDLVFLDHRHIGLFGALGLDHQRLDGGKGGIIGLRIKPAHRRQAPPAGDQAMGLARRMPAQGNHLDRGLLAAGAQGPGQRRHLFLVLFQPVAHQMGFVNGVKRDLFNQQPLGAGVFQHRCQLLQRALSRRLRGHLRDGRRRQRPRPSKPCAPRRGAEIAVLCR